ncbi:MAG: cysteine desulfurase NifS [Elusimicrobiota bacterium]|nr:cysteine desulfurase NifS [Elusimicrobiota bacterium]
MPRIYIDYNSTTPLHPEALKAMLPYLQDVYGNPSSIHWYGQQAHKALEDAREKVAKLISADPSEIVFTSGGTESNNFAIKGVTSALKKFGNHIITSQIEHHAVLNPCEYLKNEGFKVSFISVDKYGIVDLDELKKSITDDTILVTIMYANNEVGTIQPIGEIGKIISEINKRRVESGKQKIYFHTDAVQCVGKIPVDVKLLSVDLLSLSAHKIYGPKGIGALYIRKGTKIQPIIHGGHHEKNRRAGTENLPGIVGFGKACEIAQNNMEKESQHLTKLRDKLWDGISKKIEFVHMNGHPQQRLPNTLNVSFEFIEGESLLLNLDLKGIAASTGSACTSRTLEPSHVLTAMGVNPAVAQSSIRFSLGMYNTEKDIDYILEVLPEIVNRLRAMSPLYKQKNK